MISNFSKPTSAKKVFKILYLIRHGDLYNPRQIVYNWDNVRGVTMKLSSLGIEQMRQMGRLLKRKGVKSSQIYSSDFLRTKESAQIIAAELNIEKIIFLKELRETYAPALVGIPLKEMQEKYNNNVYTQDFIDKYHHETIEQVAQRYYQAILKIIKQSGEKYFLVVGHGDPIRFFREKIEYPKQKLNTEDFQRLSDTNYLAKGQAWEIKLTNKAEFISAKIIP